MKYECMFEFDPFFYKQRQHQSNFADMTERYKTSTSVNITGTFQSVHCMPDQAEVMYYTTAWFIMSSVFCQRQASESFVVYSALQQSCNDALMFSLLCSRRYVQVQGQGQFLSPAVLQPLI